MILLLTLITAGPALAAKEPRQPGTVDISTNPSAVRESAAASPQQTPQPTSALPQARREPPLTLDARPCDNSGDNAPEMVVIAAGRFEMGSPRNESGRTEGEGPRHAVAVVNPFAISRCEVSVGQFKIFVQETGYKTDAERGQGCTVWNVEANRSEQRKDRNWQDPGFKQDDTHPVVCVSWNDSQAYIRWLSARTAQTYRLPSEAEWEYAARAGSITSRFWGDDAKQACVYANGADQSLKQHLPDWPYSIHECNDNAVFTAPGGRYKRNAFGLSDMLGNVWEWTQDCWQENYQGAPRDGSAWEVQDGAECPRRVCRGGGWYNKPEYLRSANRDWSRPDEALNFLGFRLARTL